MSAFDKILSQIIKCKSDGKLGDTIFFRGQRAQQKLIPSLIRNGLKYSSSLEIAENNFYCDAWVMGANELSSNNNSWENLALFQHYQIPTRLLDWTSSLTSAIFFAISKCLYCVKLKNKGKCDRYDKKCEGNPVIWVLDPSKMHKKLHSALRIEHLIALTSGVDDIQDYKNVFVTQTEKWEFPNGPIFIEIPWKNKRIISQKGYFTFHPTEIPLESLIDENSGLIKIEINKINRTNIVKEFDVLGVTEHDVYNDIVSLGHYFDRRFSQ